MKRIITGLAMICAVACSWGADDAAKELEDINRKIKEMLAAAPKGPHGGKVISPEIKALMDRRSGGIVAPKTNGKTILLVDARNGDNGFLETFTKTMKRQFHIGVTAVTRKLPENADLFEAANGCKTMMSPAVIMIVDVEKKPTLSVYPEDAVGIVNVASFKTSDAKLYDDRLTKETWRCMALSLGGFSLTAPNGKVVKSVLSPVYSTSDLDELKVSYLTPHQSAAIYEAMSTIGIQASRPVAYSLACRQGWAPAPTNAIQKAIWEKVHAAPKNPMKIKFDPKKGR